MISSGFLVFTLFGAKIQASIKTSDSLNLATVEANEQTLADLLPCWQATFVEYELIFGVCK